MATKRIQNFKVSIKSIVIRYRTVAAVSAVVSTLLSVLVSFCVVQYSVHLQDQSDKIRSFELAANNFSTLFQKYAYEVIDSRSVNKKDKIELMNLLTKQSAQLESLKKEFPSVEQSAEELDAALVSAQLAVADQKDFQDMKQVFEKVGTLLVARDEFLDEIYSARFP